MTSDHSHRFRDMNSIELVIVFTYVSVLAVLSFVYTIVFLEFVDSLPNWAKHSAERQLLLLSVAASTLGATVSLLRNLAIAWRLNRRRIYAMHLPGILTRPFTGAVMGLFVFLSLRAGILKPTSSVDVLNSYAVAVFAAISGFLSEYLFIGLLRSGTRLIDRENNSRPTST
jgi:hypothetical protein